MRFANSRCDDKSNFAAEKFLIVRNRGDDFFSIDLGRQLRRQPNCLEQRNYLIPFLCRKARPFCRNGAGRDHPNTDAIAVRNFEIRGALDCVSDGVAKI